MNLTLITAMTRDRVIGTGGRIPWDLPEDRARFKRLTLGHPVVMGRKTYESIRRSLGGPLPGRRNLVLSRTPGASFPGCETLASPEELFRLFEGTEEEVFIIGGGEIYRLFLSRAGAMQLTIVDGSYEGDAFFPAYDPEEWLEEAKEAGKGCDYVSLRRTPTSGTRYSS